MPKLCFFGDFTLNFKICEIKFFWNGNNFLKICQFIIFNLNFKSFTITGIPRMMQGSIPSKIDLKNP
jgi:hypothetical protein